MSQLRRSVLLSGFSQYAVLILGFGKVAVISRVLSPAEVGTYTMASVLIFLTVVFREVGTRDFLIAERDLTEEKRRASFTILITMGAVTSILFFLLRNVFEGFFNAPELAGMMMVIAPAFVVNSVTAVWVAMLQREMDFRTLAYLQIFPTILDLTVSLSLIYLGYGLISLGWGYLASVSLVSLVIMVRQRGKIFYRPRFKEIPYVLRFGLQASGATLLNNVGSYAPALLLGWAMNAAAVGYFGRGQTLITFARQGVEVATRPVTQAWFAQNSHHDIGEAGKIYLQITRMIAGVAWPFYVFIYFHAATLIPYAFGPQWTISVPLAQVLALGGMFSFFAVSGTSFLTGRGEVTVAFWFNFSSLVLRLSILFVGLNYGLTGFVWAIAISHFLGFVLLGAFLNRAAGLGFGAYLANLLPGAALAACTALVNYVLIRLVYHSDTLGLWPFVVVVLANVVTYVVALIVTGHPLYAELKTILGRRIGRSG